MSLSSDELDNLLGYLHRVHEEGPFIDEDDIELYTLKITPTELGYITGMLAAHIDMSNGIIK